MLEKNFIKITELIVLGLIFPILVVYYGLSNYILFFLWIIFIYCLIIFLCFYKSKESLNKFFTIYKHRTYIYLILFRWIFFSFFLYIFTVVFFPEHLFSIQKKNISLLYKIFLFYPLFSAFPQEFIFCTYFFKRYKSLFIKEKNMIIMSSILFCFAHIFVINWVAPLIGLFGGFIFARTYSKTKSLLIVSLEHALYGNTLFFLGLGWFFWGGSVGK